jgi:hypothetical protein
MVPLVRMASECFTELESHARSAGNEIAKAGLVAMFTLKPASAAQVEASRTKLKAVEGRLLEIDSDIRKSAAALGGKVASADAPADVKSNLLVAVRESGTELVKRCRESVAYQRRLVQQTNVILAFIQPRFKRLASKPQQTAFANRADQAAFEKLVKQFDRFEEESSMVLRRLHGRGDQSKQQLLVALTRPQDQ